MVAATKQIEYTPAVEEWILQILGEAPLAGYTIEQVISRYEADFDPQVSRWSLACAIFRLRAKSHLERCCTLPSRYRLTGIGRRVLEFRLAVNFRRSLGLIGYRQLVGPWHVCLDCGQKTKRLDKSCCGGVK